MIREGGGVSTSLGLFGPKICRLSAGGPSKGGLGPHIHLLTEVRPRSTGPTKDLVKGMAAVLWRVKGWGWSEMIS